MEEKYFIIDNKNQKCGPFTADELNDIGLFQDSLILCSDWQGRKPLNQIPELSHVIRKNTSIFSSFPNYGKTEVKKIELKVFTPYTFKNKYFRVSVVCWFFFHLMALVLSQLKISFFNRNNVWHELTNQTSKVWPFVDFYSIHYGIDDRNEYFNGVFYFYDLSEFIIYSLIGLFVVFLLITINQNK